MSDNVRICVFSDKKNRAFGKGFSRRSYKIRKTSVQRQNAAFTPRLKLYEMKYG